MSEQQRVEVLREILETGGFCQVKASVWVAGNILVEFVGNRYLCVQHLIPQAVKGMQRVRVHNVGSFDLARSEEAVEVGLMVAMYLKPQGHGEQPGLNSYDVPGCEWRTDAHVGRDRR